MSQALQPGRYTTLEIRILRREADGYPVEITFSGVQHFSRGFLGADILRWTSSGSPIDDGEELFRLLFADPRLIAAWVEARGQHRLRRIQLRIDAGAPELQAIPWELLRETDAGQIPQTLAADIETPFSRYLAVKAQQIPLPDRPIKLLVAIASPANVEDYHLAALDPIVEQQAIQAAVAEVVPAEMRLVCLQQPVTLTALEEELKQGYHLLHLVCHGSYNRSQDRSVLFLANEDNQVALVDAGEFSEMLTRQNETLQLVFLASCQTATPSPVDAFRGFAPRLVGAGVPSVVAMQDLVSIEAARVFTKTFYQRLLTHGQVDVACNEARSLLLATDEVGSWGVPVLYLRVQNGMIVPPRLVISTWQWLWRRPVITRTLAIGSAIAFLLSLFVSVLDLSSYIDAARQPDGILHPILPAPTASATPIPPMPATGFNIAVAQFAALDDTGRLTVTQESEDLSAWLFEAIKKQVDQLPPSLRANLQGPDEIRIMGSDRATYTANAALVAQRQHATILVYGIVTLSDDRTHYQVEPQFYVADQSFGYGSEIAGPDRLGKPVAFTLPLEPINQEAINGALVGRAQALQFLVDGLSQFYIGQYETAWADFQAATQVQSWEAAEGQEVIYMLMGAAKLRSFDPAVTDDRDAQMRKLMEARDAFSRARDLNPQYARSYLGLGAVALQEALMVTPTDALKLSEASTWYADGQRASDTPGSAYLHTKLAYGLGQVHLAGFDRKLPGWSSEQARDFFTQVVDDYQNQPVPDLMWFVGNAHAGLGRLAGYDDDWQTMADKYREAIDMLSGLPGHSPRKYVAIYWSQVAFAEKQNGRVDAARAAYAKAIDAGQHVLNPGELDILKHELESLTQGVP